MFDRRSLLRGGFSAAALGLLHRHGWSYARQVQQALRTRDCGPTGAQPLHRSAPIAQVPLYPHSVDIGGLPFADWFTGDYFENDAIPFHGEPACTQGMDPPPPTEEVDLVVVGGGLSGLCVADLLREHEPVVFELRQRFGGAARGERWGGTTFTLGNAYVITPDAGSFLDDYWRQLGLDQVVHVDDGEFQVELAGQVLEHFLDGEGQRPEVLGAFQRYREIVEEMAYQSYPDIPLPPGDVGWILDLDRKSFRQDIEEKMGAPVPDVLAAAIQAYCYSSFAAGWEEISAASGWNFLAAEEFARWVFPGGNSYMAQAMWDRVARLDRHLPPGCEPQHLRGGCAVVDVRLVRGDRVQVAYMDSAKVCRSLLAKKVVMACPKFLCKLFVRDLYALDEPKLHAMEELRYRAYVVANVLLDDTADLDFYDIFLLGDGTYPTSQEQAQSWSRVADMLNGSFAEPGAPRRQVLTLYWPLPFDFGRWTLLIESGWQEYAASIVPQIKSMLGLVGVSPAAVRQVRLTRWGHAVPIARPGLIADGSAEALRRPIDGKIFFVNQDNWALPAVENSLLDAAHYAPQIAAGL